MTHSFFLPPIGTFQDTCEAITQSTCCGGTQVKIMSKKETNQNGSYEKTMSRYNNMFSLLDNYNAQSNIFLRNRNTQLTDSGNTNPHNSIAKKISQLDIDEAKLLMKRYSNLFAKELSVVNIDSDNDVVMLLNTKHRDTPDLNHPSYQKIQYTGDKSGMTVFSSYSDSTITGIIVSSTNKVLMYAELPRDLFNDKIETNTWQVQCNQTDIDKNSEGISINLALYISYITIASEYIRLSSRNVTKSDSKKSTPTIQSTPNYTRECCINHDLICTPPASNRIKVTFLWCEFTADISSCCVQHDIELWCGAFLPDPVSMLAYLTAINLKFSGCINGKFIDAAVNQLPWYCGGFISGLTMGALSGLITGILYLIGVELGGLIIPHSEYFPGDGRHNDCCLCGGKNPTGHCPSWRGGIDIPVLNCRDMCKERGIPAVCIDCGWRCIYDGFGRPIRVEPIRPVGNQVCCPGTEVRDYDGEQPCNLPRKSTALKNCKGKPCDRCFYRCEYTKVDGKPGMSLGWVPYFTQKLTKVGCCYPTPPYPKDTPCDKEGKTVS